MSSNIYMLSSSSSLFDAESDTSQSCKVGESSVLPKLVIGVEADAGPELVEEEAAAAAAVVEANEEPALGGWGSGAMLVRRVSHAAPPSGLRLRSRSPSPSRRG
jgi:hypothetical protein